MSAETLSISLEADIRALKAALAEMPDIGKKEASAMVRQMTKEYRKAERAAEKLAKRTERELSQSFDKAKTAAERTASTLGGAFGEVGGAIFDVGEGVADLAGSLGGDRKSVV